MKITIFIILFSWVLYKAGIIKRFLNALIIDAGPAENMTPGPEPVEPEEAPPGPPETREKWEAEARYILSIQGKTNPDTVRYMGDEMLQRIVRDYLQI